MASHFNTPTPGRTRQTAVLAGGCALLCSALLAGCHSAYVQADIVNSTGEPVSLLEVDYPSASFGTETLAPGAHYRYRFQILGEGPTKVLWTDAAHHEHTAAGPTLHEGQKGTLQVTLTAVPGSPEATSNASSGPGAVWSADLHP